ncbi:MAG: ATP-binding cassette domain-containing protein [Acidobacteria bacterium]|nr:ATP-binding cassette domain-containing protein [Acidobacteriota bacterium]MDW7984615.1 ATP-binding cassette domain-containing protein [Acidobacteriota bacterium]
MLRLVNVSKRYGDVWALHPMTLDVCPGRTTVLIGPSGCGKSTVLKIIVGLVEPTTGSVELDGERLRPDNVLRFRRRMGYVIQEGGLFPHLTAEQNILLMPRHLKIPDEVVRPRLQALCELTRFPPDALRRYPAELSGGQRQRVGLMRALVLDPDVLLLDEPLGALDPMVRAALQEDLKAIFTRLGKTVLLVTHDMAEAAFLADEVVLMDAGRVVQRGTVADLIERPATPFVTQFITAQRRSGFMPVGARGSLP